MRDTELESSLGYAVVLSPVFLLQNPQTTKISGYQNAEPSVTMLIDHRCHSDNLLPVQGPGVPAVSCSGLCSVTYLRMLPAQVHAQ